MKRAETQSDNNNQLACSSSPSATITPATRLSCFILMDLQLFGDPKYREEILHLAAMVGKNTIHRAWCDHHLFNAAIRYSLEHQPALFRVPGSVFTHVLLERG